MQDRNAIISPMRTRALSNCMLRVGRFGDDRPVLTAKSAAKTVKQMDGIALDYGRFGGQIVYNQVRMLLGPRSPCASFGLCGGGQLGAGQV